MENLLKTSLLPYLNKHRPGNVAPVSESTVNVSYQDKSEKLFDIVDIKDIGGTIFREYTEGQASYTNEHSKALRFIEFERFMNDLGDVSKNRKRADYLVYTLDSKDYFVVHEISTGSIRNKRKDGRHQLENTVELFGKIPVIKKYLGSFTERICCLSGMDDKTKDPVSIDLMGGFNDIYDLLPDPEPINSRKCLKHGFKCYISHNVKIV